MNLPAETFPVPLTFLRGKERHSAWLCGSRASLAQLEGSAPDFLGFDERERLRSFTFPERRRSYLLGRYCAKQAVLCELEGGDPCSIQILSSVFQQPVLVGSYRSSLRVSITHGTGRCVAAAFDAAHPLGIDLETLDTSRLATMESQLLTGEREVARDVGSMTSLSAALFWTAREALSKVLGTGLTVAISLYEIESCKQIGTGHFEGAFRHFPQYKFSGFTDGDTVLTLVFPRRSSLENPCGNFIERLGLK